MTFKSLLFLCALFCTLHLSAQESNPGDCSDGIDNDGDNLIDYYDDDCPCDGQNYYGTCASACSATTFPSTPFSMEEQWRTDHNNYGFDNRQVAMVADIDADGFPDVVVKDDGDLNELYIFDGRDGSHKLTINAPEAKQFNIGIAIADVDLDGFGEIIMATSDKGNSFDHTRRLICFEHNGPIKWVASKQTGVKSSDSKLTPGIADFNGDGVAEVYVGDEIYNAQTGVFIASGGGSRGENSASAGEAFSVAADVLPDGACTNCTGQELVAGNVVYSVDISGAALAVEVTAAGGIPDGFTSIADLDNDNDFDAVITSGGKVYAWDLQTSTQLGTAFDIGSASTATSNSTAGGIANVADFDGDGFVEIGLAGKNVYVVLEYNIALGVLEEKWSTYVKDGSGRTGSSVFDYEGDGSAEVVYKGEQYLWVMNGTTGAIKAQVACGSGTRTDYPLVVDVDADGATEIICSCAENSGPNNANTSYVIAFEATDRPWVHARKLWNQFQYNITNINDDLTIPAIPQKGFYIGASHNTYLSQAPILDEFGNYVIDAADLIVEIISTDVNNCPTNQIEVTVKVTNQGNATAKANTPVSFYEEDPTGLSTYIGVGLSSQDLDQGESETFSVTLNVAGLSGTFNLFAVVNSTLTSTPFSYATDFPAGPIPECDYTNNYDSESTGCCGVANAGEIDGPEQNCNSFDPASITSISSGGDDCINVNVYNNTGTSNGSDRLDYASTISGFTSTDSDFTFETWIRYLAGEPSNANLIFMNGPNHDVRFQVTTAFKIRVRFVSGKNYTSTSTLTDGAWHHIAATYSSSTVKLYIDGNLDVTHPTTEVANIHDHTSVQVGQRGVGQLDNIKIYNKALSDAEVLTAKDNCSYRNSGSLQAWWNFDTNTGTQDVIDLVGVADLNFRNSNPSRTTPGGSLPSPSPPSYEWEEANDPAGPWSAISSSDSETYDPSTISQTTYYRRGIVNSGSCENTYTNIIEKRIGSALDNGGAIGSDEEGCPNFTPISMTETTAPTYSTPSAPSIDYQWQIASDPAGPWMDISGATSSSYSPTSISSTSYYRRASQESSCAGQFYSNVIEKKIITATFYEAGSISGDEAGCPAYTPADIIGTAPSGSYTFAYQWQSSLDEANWSDIAGATSADLTFSINLLNSTYYRRLVTEMGCTVYNISNTVTKLVKTNITAAGVLSGDEAFCSDFDPAAITGTAPTGGGPVYEYIWEQTDSPDNTWSEIISATSDSYDPPMITATTYYRRGVKSVGPSCTIYTYSDPIAKEVFTSNVEENEFSGDEYQCGAFDPTAMVDEQSPSSGVEFQWESASDPSGSWAEISGANGAAYDPSTISSTTYYRRKVRETGCSGWQEPAEYITKSIACECGAGTIILPGSNAEKVATDTCTSGVWAYYYDPANPSQLLFGIELFPTGGNTNSFDANITIKTTQSLTGTTAYADSVYLEEESLSQEAMYVMGRNWNIDVVSGSPNGFVNIRFFYDERESSRIEALGAAWKDANGSIPNILNVSDLIWFQSLDAPYDPETQHLTTGLNVKALELTPAEYGFINGVRYVQFDGITDLRGGSAAVRVGTNPVLPIELLNFKGKAEQKVNVLNWTTASEQNASHFIVERMDPLNQQFLPISAAIKAVGNSFEEQDYQFIDAAPLKGAANYYRLLMKDKDGSGKHSDILVISRSDVAEKGLKVFPNPSTGVVNFSYLSDQSGKVKLQVIDISGRIINLEKRTSIAGLMTKGRVNLSGMPPGIYVLQVIGERKVERVPFVLSNN